MMESKIKEIANEIADLVERKNKDYGNSFDKTLDEYGDVAYFLRVEDKISRLKSLSNRESLVTDESIEDTLKDIIGYTLLMLNHKRYRNEENKNVVGGDTSNGEVKFLYKFDTTNYPEIVLIQYHFQQGPK